MTASSSARRRDRNDGRSPSGYHGAMTAPSDTDRIAEAIDRFDPTVARAIRAVRLALRRRFLTAYELIWDNYNAFVIAYGTSERPSDSIVSLAADMNGVNLEFARGASLPDPHGLLLGNGKFTRFVRLPDADASIARPEVAALIDAAAAQASGMRRSGSIVTILRSVSAKQRPRRRNGR